LDYSSVALLATIGLTRIPVFRKPHVALLATGDEIVEPAEQPSDFQIRNSNVYSLAAQVARAGGEASILPVAKDESEATRISIERGLEADLLLLSGGVSAGKYDLVEGVPAGIALCRWPLISCTLAGVERCPGAGPRQRIPGGRRRSRTMESRRLDPGSPQMKKLSHYDAAGSARMVDVSAKLETRRMARAQA